MAGLVGSVVGSWPNPGGAPPATAYCGTVAVPWPAAPPGVGSKRSQPMPLKYSSGQACASAVVTFQSPLPVLVPAV